MKTLVAVYEDPHTAQLVIEALLETGFSGDDISLLVQDRRSVASSGEISGSDAASLGALVGALVGIGSALVPGIGPLIGGGAVGVAMTVGIGAAAGALTGGLSVGLLDLESGEDAPDLRAGTVVSVTSNEEWLEWAQKIMLRYDPIKIEEREAKWYTGGWAASSAMASDGRSVVDDVAAGDGPSMVDRPPSSPAIKRVKRVQIYDN